MTCCAYWRRAPGGCGSLDEGGPADDADDARHQYPGEGLAALLRVALGQSNRRAV
jgi:hypothetical protein